jgi:HAE1 family hydrophobic/amphiphilic exporter-1
VIGGLVVSTLLTLIVIPVMYAVLDRRPDVMGHP